MVRVRFAPSPTGYLHIGGVRTALFNYLYARNQGGKFLVRIEDTDRERYLPEYEKEIMESLDWIGFESDEPIVCQSERLDRYGEAAKELIEKDLAYHEGEDRKAVRFRIQSNPSLQKSSSNVFYDLVHDAVAYDASLYEDLVIIKSDGYPTYHFACVVDDHDMGMTHVIRGDDHLSNTPRQILLYQAMGWKPPKFGHLPLILGADGSPLSKRHGAVALSSFRKKTFLSESLINYLALLGWNPKGDEEFFTSDLLIKKFGLKQVNKSSAQFDFEKLEWLNGMHIKNMPEEDYVRGALDFLGNDYQEEDPQRRKKFALLYRTRIKKYEDLKKNAHYFLEDDLNYDSEKIASLLQEALLEDLLKKWIDGASMLSDFNQDSEVEAMTRRVSKDLNVQAKQLIHPLRYVLSAEDVTPGLFELMSALGKDRCLNRVGRFIQIMKQR